MLGGFMDKFKKDLIKMIDYGTIIHSYNIEEKYIEFFEGLNYKDRIINIKKYTNVNFSDLEDVISSEKFKNSIFRKNQKGILLVDIVGFSKGEMEYQAGLLNLFNNGFNQALEILQIFSHVPIIEQVIPTGDGCYLVLNEIINDRFLLVPFAIMSSIRALENEYFINNNLKPEEQNHLQLRIGAELGEISFFNDVSGKNNCFGTGMNETARILTYGQSTFEKNYTEKNSADCIYIGENILHQATNIVNHINKFHKECEIINLGIVKDKHNKERKVYVIINLPERMAFQLFTSNEKYNL
jgi:hypothetical protein